MSVLITFFGLGLAAYALGWWKPAWSDFGAVFNQVKAVVVPGTDGRPTFAASALAVAALALVIAALI